MCKSRELCQEYQHENKRKPMISYPIPSRKWQMIATDLFEISGRQFLIICGKFSKFPLVDEIPSPTSSEAITNKIHHYCTLFRKPQKIYSDNGPQYTGQSFREFCKKWGIEHITSSLTHSRSNGFIECQIGYIKPLLEKSICNHHDIHLTLLNIRATPINTKLRSPAELLLGELIVTLLPSHSTVEDESVRDELYQAQERMMNHDEHSTKKFELPPLIAGQQVRVLSHKKHRWFPGTVIDVNSSNPRSYSINTNGRTIRRNCCHLRGIESSSEPNEEQTPQITQKRVTFTDNEETPPSLRRPETPTEMPTETPAEVSNCAQPVVT